MNTVDNATNETIARSFDVPAEWFFDHLPEPQAEALLVHAMNQDLKAYRQTYQDANGDGAMGALLWDKQLDLAKHTRAMSTVTQSTHNTLYLGAFQGGYIQGLSSLMLVGMQSQAGITTFDYQPPFFNLVKARWVSGADQVTIIITDRAL